MFQLEGAKCSFVFCLGLSILICSVIYLRARVPTEPKAQAQAQGGHLSCKPFAPQCSTFLGRVEGGLLWRRRGCEVESYLLDRDKDCSQLAQDLHFITKPLSREEEAYPLAFILTVHKELELLVRLLRAVYAPQNVYCVHVDSKAPLWYRATVKHLLSCLPNAFLASRSETVTYGGFSRLQADINCMRDLARSKVAWRKVVNLCGQDFPVMSNLELVRHLQSKQWRDRNMTPGVKQPGHIRYRTEYQHAEVKGSHVQMKGRMLKKQPPPHSLELYFGTAYYAVTRAFVNYVLESPVARDLLEWSKDTFSPDEHFWVTLNHIKETPGNHVEGGWEGEIRAIKWKDQEGTAHTGCKGRYVRDICVYGVDDLQWLIDRNSMFANKFESGALSEALDCLEQWHRDKVLRQAAVSLEPTWLLAVQDYSNSSSSSIQYNLTTAGP
ncbi:beta-1,3-galactosyl-O-glycosyl-glycoprotein beta-1,6-N-acetylglucosaminyltransferase 7 [Aplochiton taeniatus]